MKHEQFLDSIIKTLQNWDDTVNNEELQRQYKETISTLERFRQFACDIDSTKKTLNELLVEFSKGSLRALLLINTGGIFVVMTLLTSLLKDSNIYNIRLVAAETKYFVFGVSAAVVTILLSYLSQWIYTSFAKSKYGFIPNVLAMLAGVASFVLFLRGAMGLQNVFCSLIK